MVLGSCSFWIWWYGFGVPCQVSLVFWGTLPKFRFSWRFLGQSEAVFMSREVLIWMHGFLPTKGWNLHADRLPCAFAWLSYLHYFQERRPFLWELLEIWCARGPPYALSSGTYTFITFVPSWSHPIAESFLSSNERKLHLLQRKVPLSEEFALTGWVLLFLAKGYAALTNCAHVVKMDQNNFLWNR